jgi:hypothetical protein
MGRVDGIEKSISVAHDDLVRVPTAVDKAVETLRQLTWERFATVTVKFEGITTQFSERDTRVNQMAEASKEALNAALQAAKELVGGQQQGNSLAITALGTTFQQTTKATDEKIDDLKERLTRIEGTGKGRTDVWGYVVAVAGLLIALAAMFRGHV